MISLIIPCYFLDESYVEMTKDCIDSAGEVDELIIVNDGSPITTSFETIWYPENGGYTKAANTGLELARGDILVLGNNDLLFHDNWLRELTWLLDIGYDVATVWTSDQKVKLEDRIEKDAKFGSIFAMKRHVYEAIGGFDPTFRGYFADTDYRLRILDEGFKIGKNLSSVIEHKSKATYEIVDPNDIEFNRAKVLFEQKWGYGED